MKKYSLNINILMTLFFSALLVTSEVVVSQEISMQLMPPQLNRLVKDDLTSFRVDFPPNPAAITSHSVFLVSSVTDASGQLVVTVTTGSFTITSGSITNFTRAQQPPIRDVYTLPEYESVKRGEEFPKGTYQINLRLYGSDKRELASYATTHIVRPTEIFVKQPSVKSQVTYQLQLIIPRDNAEIVEQQPVFQWLINPPAPEAEYELAVWEVESDQSISEAVSNAPYFEEKGIQNTSFVHPFGAKSLEHGKTYCWQVSAGIDGTLLTTSEIRMYQILRVESTKTGSPDIINIAQDYLRTLEREHGILEKESRKQRKGMSRNAKSYLPLESSIQKIRAAGFRAERTRAQTEDLVGDYGIRIKEEIDSLDTIKLIDKRWASSDEKRLKRDPVWISWNRLKVYYEYSNLALGIGKGEWNLLMSTWRSQDSVLSRITYAQWTGIMDLNFKIQSLIIFIPSLPDVIRAYAFADHFQETLQKNRITKDRWHLVDMYFSELLNEQKRAKGQRVWNNIKSEVDLAKLAHTLDLFEHEK